MLRDPDDFFLPEDPEEREPERFDPEDRDPDRDPDGRDPEDRDPEALEPERVLGDAPVRRLGVDGRRRLLVPAEEPDEDEPEDVDLFSGVRGIDRRR